MKCYAFDDKLFLLTVVESLDFRSSHQEVFLRKAIAKIYMKFKGEDFS